jgi:hypothetical protein
VEKRDAPSTGEMPIARSVLTKAELVREYMGYPLGCNNPQRGSAFWISPTSVV